MVILSGNTVNLSLWGKWGFYFLWAKLISLENIANLQYVIPGYNDVLKILTGFRICFHCCIWYECCLICSWMSNFYGEMDGAVCL